LLFTGTTVALAALGVVPASSNLLNLRELWKSDSFHIGIEGGSSQARCMKYGSSKAVYTNLLHLNTFNTVQ